MKTDLLVEALVAGLTPVRRISPPWRRLVWWLAISVPAVGLVVWMFGLRPDLLRHLGQTNFLLYEAAALLTGVVGAYAALCAGLPDQPSWKSWLPIAPLALWVGTLGHQCLDVLLRLGPAGLTLTSDAMCLPAIAIGGVVPAITMVLLLRQSRQFRATPACLCGALAAAAFSAAVLRLYHTEDAALMVLVWQLGSVALFTLLAGAMGRLLLASHRPWSIQL